MKRKLVDMPSLPYCYTNNCIHYLGFKKEGNKLTGRIYCKAFPDKIPDRIAYGKDKHKVKAHDQENNIIYEKRNMGRADRNMRRSF